MSGLCAVMLLGVAMVVVNRDDPPDQVRAGLPFGEQTVPEFTEGGVSPVGAGAPRVNGRIAFIRSTGPSDPAPKIHVINADGTGQTMIAETTRGSDLTWSPDGTRLAFSDVGGIYVVNADGSGETRVPTTTENTGRRKISHGDRDHRPTWSPDGAGSPSPRAGTTTPARSRSAITTGGSR